MKNSEKGDVAPSEFINDQELEIIRAVLTPKWINTPYPRPSVPSPDAELIRLCGEFDVIQRQIYDCDTGGATPIEDDAKRQEVVSPLEGKQRELLEKILELRAVTMEGFLARAKTYRLYQQDVFEIGRVGSSNWNDRMAVALIRDMLGEALP